MMKTAISIPDEIFARAEHLARKLGKTRSQLYVEAITVYLAERDSEELTERINVAIDELGPDATRIDPVLARMQARSLLRDEW